MRRVPGIRRTPSPRWSAKARDFITITADTFTIAGTTQRSVDRRCALSVVRWGPAGWAWRQSAQQPGFQTGEEVPALHH
jgi:hypothetical protein